MSFDFDFSHNAKSKAMYHTMSDVVKNTTNKALISCTMTGLCKGLKEGNLVILNRHTILKVSEIIEQRDHKGNFSNNEDRKKAWFKAKFTRA